MVQKLVSTVSLNIANFVVAWLAAVIYSGGDPSVVTIAKIVLAVKLNVFAIPLSWTPALSLPLWIYYVISVLWLAQIVHYTEYSVAGIVGEVEADVQRLRR